MREYQGMGGQAIKMHSQWTRRSRRAIFGEAKRRRDSLICLIAVPDDCPVESVPSEAEWLTVAVRGRQNADEALAMALASGQTLRDAAVVAGVSERAATRRWADAAFRGPVDAARRHSR